MQGDLHVRFGSRPFPVFLRNAGENPVFLRNTGGPVERLAVEFIRRT
jgi:hypothetical protein